LQGGPSSPLLYNLLTFDVLNILVDLIANDPDIFICIYADDIAIISRNLHKLQLLLDKLIQWATLNGLKINENKTKVVKFRRGGPLKKDDYLHINGVKLEFVNEFKYLGVTVQQSGKCFSHHIIERSKLAISASYSISNVHLLSVSTAMKLFDLKISPVASYGIQIVWPYLSVRDFNLLESVKSRFIKRILSLSKYTLSRYVYKLINTKFFVSELRDKFQLPCTLNYNKFLVERENKEDEINLAFYRTPAFKSNAWMKPNCRNRNIFTRYAIHGFHHLICTNKKFHDCSVNCKCTLCNAICSRYHLLTCPKRTLSLFQYSVLDIV
jgi:hypothetical protein